MEKRRPRHITLTKRWPQRYFSSLSAPVKLMRERELLKRKRTGQFKLGKSDTFAKPRKSKASREFMDKALAELEPGQVRSGKVSSMKPFGIFVDLGGIEGLVHISEMSWSRIGHPSDKVAVGDVLNVFVLLVS